MRHLSDSHRAKISAALTGKHLSEETRAKVGAAFRGKPLSPEHRARVIAGLMGRPVSPETRAKLAVAHLGRRFSHTPEARAKIRAAQLGRVKGPHTAEARAKMSAANLGNTSVRNAPVKGECVYCFGPAQTHDHVIPRGRPGWDDPENVVLACFRCNRSKQRRTPEEWFASLTAGLSSP